ncbi:MAG: hypothetical protein M1818_000504 [Claussenomyces sp. TS43310]|nr:MAG: hypothetical protein M1818_000504 [Claussenomyces sp. TS43310]
MLNRVRAANMRLVTSLEDAGIRAQPINSGVFSAVKSSSEQSRGDEPLGSPTAVSRRAIDSAIRTGCVPVLSSLGLSDSGQVLRLDVAQATVQLSQLLQPLKVIFLLEERKMVEAKSVQSSKNFIPFLTQEAKGEVQHHNPRFEIAERRPTLVAVKEIVESLAGSSSIFLARAANLIEALLAGTASRQLGERPWVVLRKAREFRVVTSVWQFEDLGAVKSVLRRHWQAQGMANASEAAERFVLCLRNRRFVAYFDKDPMENLAIVFLDSTHSWKADAAMRMPELSVFAISSQGWMDEVAEQLWARVNEDHKSVWGTIHDKDHSLEWWLTKVNGSIRRAPEVIFWCGEPELSHSVEEMLESENLLVAAVAA